MRVFSSYLPSDQSAVTPMLPPSQPAEASTWRVRAKLAWVMLPHVVSSMSAPPTIWAMMLTAAAAGFMKKSETYSEGLSSVTTAAPLAVSAALGPEVVIAPWFWTAPTPSVPAPVRYSTE